MDYYIYLKNTDEWIRETDNELIWTKTSNQNYAFNDNDYKRVNNIAMFICKDKNLRMNIDVIIISEEIKVITNELPVGIFNTLYTFLAEKVTDNEQDMIDYVGERFNITSFDEPYRTIDTYDELLSWCEHTGYSVDELEDEFKIKLFRNESE